MGPPSYMRSVVDRKVGMRRMTVSVELQEYLFIQRSDSITHRQVPVSQTLCPVRTEGLASRVPLYVAAVGTTWTLLGLPPDDTLSKKHLL